MVSRISTISICVLVFLTVISGTSSAPVNSQCQIDFNILPARILNCFSGVKIYCSETTVCYSSNQAKAATMCISNSYSHSASSKFKQCLNSVSFIIKPGSVVCIEEGQIRKFNTCFNDGV
eukprot:IDg5810t1